MGGRSHGASSELSSADAGGGGGGQTVGKRKKKNPTSEGGSYSFSKPLSTVFSTLHCERKYSKQKEKKKKSWHLFVVCVTEWRAHTTTPKHKHHTTRQNIKNRFALLILFFLFVFFTHFGNSNTAG